MSILVTFLIQVILLVEISPSSHLPSESVQKDVFNMNQYMDSGTRTVECDVIIAGGSTAAFGAAIAAARRNVNNIVCLTEPTDWLGGQLTSSGVSAIDFGTYNIFPKFQSAAFEDMISSLGEGNPGKCWHSIKCYEPLHLINGWINKTINVLPNLIIFYNTVIKKVDASDRLIHGVTGIQRTVKPGFKPWTKRLSSMITDWYSEEDSNIFTKQTINFVAKEPRTHPIVIEATEYGDVLALSESSYRIGVEAPLEDSNTTIENCGQCVTIPFFMVASHSLAPKQDLPHPGGKYSFLNATFGGIWAFRRALGLDIMPYDQLHLGETSQQNWAGGNDLCEGFMYLSKSKTTEQLSDWQGGLNLTTLSAAEDRGWGWYHFYKGNLSKELQSHVYLGMSNVVGTNTGLTKVPYFRDSRRSIGLDGFLMTKKDQLTPGSNLDRVSQIKFATKYHDSIAIGDYISAFHKLKTCKWPKYTDSTNILPFHIPFRSLTNQDFDNLLLAGKTMAQTEAGNAPSRMHPTEFLTGEAAGTASIIMVEQGLSTRQMYQQVKELQQELVKFMPIFWDHPRNTSYKL